MVDIRETLGEKLKVATEAQLSAEELAARMDELMEAELKRQKVSYIQHGQLSKRLTKAAFRVQSFGPISRYWHEIWCRPFQLDLSPA